MNTEWVTASTSVDGYAAAVVGFVNNTGDYTNYGGKFQALGKSGRAVEGEAPGSDAYAGYFIGRGYFSGNVGIGTTNPSEMLHINKPYDSTGIRVSSDTGS